jgi:hypothetical protein
MMYRMLPLAALGFVLFIGAPALAANDADDTTHTGKVVSIADDKLVMTDKDGKERTHILTGDVKLTCDGKVCKYEDLRPGMRIRVTTKKDDNKTVSRIEALNKNEEFEKRDK